MNVVEKESEQERKEEREYKRSVKNYHNDCLIVPSRLILSIQLVVRLLHSALSLCHSMCVCVCVRTPTHICVCAVRGVKTAAV